MNRIRCAMALGLLAILQGFCQETKIFDHQQKAYQDALLLYHNKQYRAAQTLFEKVGSATTAVEIKANSAYYAANAAIRLNQRGSDKQMEDFVARYPTATKRNSAFMDVGNYYFQTGKYPYAIKWYKKVDQAVLPKKDRQQFNFNNGYAYYQADRPKDAERYLKRISDSGEYGAQAKYYLGFIAYEQDDYTQASERFDKITDPRILEEKMGYYQADLNFKSGNFEKAIQMAQQQLPKANRREQSELNKIIGEGYFNLKKYQEAIPHLKLYRGKRGKFSNTDFYLLGYSYYQLNNYEAAVGQFNKIIDGTNSVAQNAYYHLAECYLKLDKKSEALNAFRNASQMDFSTAIEKDALLNYARLSYEIGNAYEPVPEVITTYLEKYPKDEHEKEMKTLLVDSFISSKNFGGAMALLDKNPAYANVATYQKVAFYNGTERFLAGDYEAAMAYYAKALKKGGHSEYQAKAQYWQAEAAFRLGHYNTALDGFTAFSSNAMAKRTNEYASLEYQMGHTYFKLNEYPNAIRHFKTAVVALDLPQQMVVDSYMRLGDAHFVTRNYTEAITAYGRAATFTGPERDYATFQSAICHGFLGNNAKKIKGLTAFAEQYPKSPYRDDALFELANTYVKADNGGMGLQLYEQLILEYGKSKFVPQALLRQGLVHYNTGNDEVALSNFKSVVQAYPKTAEAKQAVAQAKLIYVDMGQVGAYAAWAKTLDFIEVSEAELDTASFEAAQRKAMEGDSEASIKAYENYLNNFPNGVEALTVNFKLAQLYFSDGQKDKALPYYKTVADSEGGEHTEQSLTRICEIYIEKGDYLTAMAYLKWLEGTAEIRQNQTFAQSNLMKGYYKQEDYKNTLAYAEKVLKAPNIDARIRGDAQIMIARAALETGNDKLAETAFAEVKRMATGETAAEAWYYDAFFKHRNGQFKASNISVQRLAKDFSAYKAWGGKGLVIMAKNFYALGDAFQATYILESVLENFTAFADITAEAQEELRAIKSREAETNSSIAPGGQ